MGHGQIGRLYNIHKEREMPKPHIDIFNGLMSEKMTYDEYRDMGLLGQEDIGRGLQINFEGTKNDDTITFAPSEEYEIKTNFEYQVDLAFADTAELADTTKLVIQNGNETIQLITPTHRTADTPATYADLQQLMVYDSTNGYRWMFKATCKEISEGVRVLLVYPTVINLVEIQNQIDAIQAILLKTYTSKD